MKTTSAFAAFAKVEDNDDGTITVTGIASTGEPDSDGETILPQAMKAALPDYMRFGAVREMHQATTAAGTAISAKVDDEGLTHFSCLVVDDDAIKKVKTGVYKGFSVGGKVLEREPLDKSVITAVKLTEISLVDRPCNPGAVINMWKADSMDKTTATGSQAGNQEGAVDALAELINKGDVTVEELYELAKAAKAKKADGKGADKAGTAAGPGTIPAGEDAGEGEDVPDEFAKKDYSDDERKDMADKGEALPDGSFPIKNKKDLSNAVKAFGRAKDKDKAKKHIKARAKALGAEDSLPDKWEDDGAEKAAKATDLAKGKDGADTSVQNTGVADVKNADTPMLPSPKVGDPMHITVAGAKVAGKIVELGDAATSRAKMAPDNGAENSDCMIDVSTAGMVWGDVGDGVNAWHVDPATKMTSVAKKAAGAGDDLRKGMWTVSDFARLLQEVIYLQNSVQWETDQEKDGSTIAAQLAQWGADGCKLLLAYVQEEAKEAFSGIDDPDNVEAVILELSAGSTRLGKCDEARLAKAIELAAGEGTYLAKAGARHSKADMEHLQGMHDSLCKLGVKCSKDNLEKDDDEDAMEMSAKSGDLAKAVASGDLAKVAKAVNDQVMAKAETLVKSATDAMRLKHASALKKVQDEAAAAIGKLQEDMAKVMAQPAPSAAHAGAAVTVSKEQDNGTAGGAAAKQVEEVKKADGTKDEAATALKKIHASGGVHVPNGVGKVA